MFSQENGSAAMKNAMVTILCIPALSSAELSCLSPASFSFPKQTEDLGWIEQEPSSKGNS